MRLEKSRSGDIATLLEESKIQWTVCLTLELLWED
jgi:hypothetical protein